MTEEDIGTASLPRLRGSAPRSSAKQVVSMEMNVRLRRHLAPSRTVRMGRPDAATQITRDIRAAIGRCVVDDDTDDAP